MPAAPGRAMGSLAELLGDRRWRSRALLGLGLASVGLATYWGIFASGPDLVREVLGPSVSDGERQAAASWAYLLMNCTGGLLGLLAFAPSRPGRGDGSRSCSITSVRWSSCRSRSWAPQTYAQALWLLPVMAFFVVGMHAGYAIYFPELFPTRLRATGSSFCFNLGRGRRGAVVRARSAVRWAASARPAGMPSSPWPACSSSASFSSSSPPRRGARTCPNERIQQGQARGRVRSGVRMKSAACPPDSTRMRGLPGEPRIHLKARFWKRSINRDWLDREAAKNP